MRTQLGADVHTKRKEQEQPLCRLCYDHMSHTSTILLATLLEMKGLSFLAALIADPFASSPFSDLQDHSCFNQLMKE